MWVKYAANFAIISEMCGKKANFFQWSRILSVGMLFKQFSNLGLCEI